jgi:hypothetical protein
MSAKLMIRASVFVALAGVLLYPTALFAQHFSVVGRQAQATMALVSDGDTFETSVDAGSSYCCETLPPSGSSAFFSSSTVQLRSYSVPQSLISGRYAGFDSPRMHDGSARLCFVVPATTAFAWVVLSIGVVYGPLTNVTIYCEETTLYGGFNTNVTDFNFLEITNTLEKVTTPVSDRTLNLTLTAVNTTPDPDVTIIDQEAFSVAAGTRRDINIHERAGAGVFGTLKLTHNGAPGAIKAVLSQYNITTLTPTLDFAPVAQDMLRVRGETAGPAR